MILSPIPQKEWDRAADLIMAAGDVVIACHVGPDGDALGSMLGLGKSLARTGKKVWMSWGTPGVRIPPQYAFLPGLDLLVQPDDVPVEPDLFIAIDCGDKTRLESLITSFDAAKATINIDHHISNDSFAQVNLVDPHAASSSELAYELVKRMGLEISPEEAMCFYTGIVTDTGRFQYSNATARTLRIAAELREMGIDHVRVNTEVYDSSSFAYLRVLGIVLSRAKLENGIVWSWVTQEDLDGLSLDETEHFIDALRLVKEAEVAVLLKEQPEGGFKASLRSRGQVDVADVAQSLGGGGHARASGFSSEGPVDRVMEAIRERLSHR